MKQDEQHCMLCITSKLYQTRPDSFPSLHCNIALHFTKFYSFFPHLKQNLKLYFRTNFMALRSTLAYSDYSYSALALLGKCYVSASRDSACTALHRRTVLKFTCLVGVTALCVPSSPPLHCTTLLLHCVPAVQ
jgi:hypothetical protein